MSQATDGNDAQRELEQKALKNVRALVDKLEEKEVRERTSQKKVLIWLVAGIAALLVVVFAGNALFPPGASQVKEIESSPDASTPRK